MTTEQMDDQTDGRSCSLYNLNASKFHAKMLGNNHRSTEIYLKQISEADEFILSDVFVHCQ